MPATIFCCSKVCNVNGGYFGLTQGQDVGKVDRRQLA